VEREVMKKIAILIGVVASALVVGQSVQAKPKSATCFVTGIGNYPCTFTPMEADGSFKISARNKDTYILTMNGDNTAFAFVQVRGRGRNIALPGTYIRDPADRACWANFDPSFRICAR
jgi:hypothetical protein